MPEPQPLIFFGTPEFAVPALEAVCAAGWAPALVITQPARPVGRGRRLQDPPVARRAGELGLEIAQPGKLSEPRFRGRLAEIAPAVAVVVAYGRIFPDWLLDLPALGCVNLHASLLPRWRGAAPIQAAIAAGDRVTGVTTMLMEEGLDTGPILLRGEVGIGPRETAPELSGRLADLGARLMVETLRSLAGGSLAPRPQPDEGVTHAPRIRREDGRVDWALPAQRIYDRLRAFTPWPGLTASLGGEPLRVAACEPAGAGSQEDAAPGEVVSVDGGELVVACGGGSRLAISRVQRPGRSELAVADFLRGARIAPGDRFDPPPRGAG